MGNPGVLLWLLGSSLAGTMDYVTWIQLRIMVHGSMELSKELIFDEKRCTRGLRQVKDQFDNVFTSRHVDNNKHIWTIGQYDPEAVPDTETFPFNVDPRKLKPLSLPKKALTQSPTSNPSLHGGEQII
ncbi:predicted protein [Lichtheimia corymbifera JMRC:FSU:9682]|uniref:Uncharacterized protein n=1 Tax=Lichtheimia corymbifera JMRC:FSU:9682 TaxID=1263082 RepID=A0A068SD27_9FUNG|nr:predicted protein [Lichtheimia corymbifera JMRC:FSU:9682]